MSGGLDTGRLAGLLAAEEVEVASLAVLATTGSTNDDAAALAPGWEGRGLGPVVVAGHQSGGRGRLGRSWAAPPGASIAVSVVLRLPHDPRAWGWVPLLAGQAAREAVTGELARLGASGEARLKWPNDVLLHGTARDGKVAGLLAEVRGGTVVVGAGINTSLGAADLPVPTATSLALASGAAGADATVLVAAYLTGLDRWWRAWTGAGCDADACGLRAAHLRWSDTVGREVRVELPGGVEVTGRAVDVDAAGHLVLDTVAGRRSLGAGDVVHVRPKVRPVLA